MNDSVKALITWLSDEATKGWIVAVLTAVGAILAWATKLKWAEEYKTVVEAKMALIEEKAKRDIEYTEKKLKDYAQDLPNMMKENFATMKQIHEERIAKLEQELEKARQEINEKEQMIVKLQKQAITSIEEIAKLEEAKAVLANKVAYIREQLSTLAERDEQIIQILNFMNSPDFPIDAVDAVLQRFDSEKRWMLSEARENLKKAEASRLAEKRKGYAEMKQKERRTFQMRQAIPPDEEKRN